MIAPDQDGRARRARVRTVISQLGRLVKILHDCRIGRDDLIAVL